MTSILRPSPLVTPRRVLRRGVRSVLLAMALTLPGLATAFDALRLSGFGSFAYSHESADDIAFLRNLSQPVPPGRDGSFRSDSILGLQLNYRWSPEWELAAQAVARHKADPSLGNSVEWAYLAWRPDEALDVRIGRVGVDVFLLSDYRNLSYSQTWVRPPREFYGWIPFFSLDGADVAWRFDAVGVRWQLKAQAGVGKTPFPLTEDVSFDFRVRRFGDLTLTAEQGPWLFKAGHASFRVGSDPPTIAPLATGLGAVAGGGFGPISDEARRLVGGMSLKDSRVRYSSLGASYDDGVWTLQAELARVSAGSRLSTTGTAGYASVGRRFGALTPYLAVARFRPGRDAARAQTDWNVLGPQAGLLQRQALAAYNVFRVDQRSVTVGARWDFAPTAALKVQWDRSHVKGHGFGLWQVDNVVGGNQGRRIDLFSIAVDFLF